MTRPSSAEIQALVRFSGSSLLAGGVLAALVNLVLTPLLPVEQGSIAVSTSTALVIRLPLAALSVALTTLGLIGLYSIHAARLRLGRLAFLVAAAGGFMTFAVECVQFTLLRDFAFAAPETLDRLETAGELFRWDVGFAVGAATFLLGWIAVAVLVLRGGVLHRRGPATLLAGMVLIPVLGALLPGLWGIVAGNLVLGAGWALLGLDLRRSVD